jgi:hypothetical protein
VVWAAVGLAGVTGCSAEAVGGPPAGGPTYTGPTPACTATARRTGDVLAVTVRSRGPAAVTALESFLDEGNHAAHGRLPRGSSRITLRLPWRGRPYEVVVTVSAAVTASCTAAVG